MKRFLLLLTALLLLPACALAVTSIPNSVTMIEESALANTAIDALIIPASVQRVGANVLAGSNASYIYLNSAATVLDSGANNGVPFVFGPAASAASALEGFYATETLASSGSLYYSVTDTALPLCAQAPFSLYGSVTIPKLVNGVPVTSLETLYLDNTHISSLRVPEYLTIPDGLSASTYQTMSLQEPVPDVSETPAGRYVTWTTELEGAYGSVSYHWTFDVNGETISTITAEPTIKYAPMAEGTCTVSVTAEDAVGDVATATGGVVTVTAAQPQYRALLIGNSYPGEGSTELNGPETDLRAMALMLNSMPGTRYSITTTRNQTADAMKASIVTAFSRAQPADVSLFYFSGHGTSSGSLVGTGGTTLTVYGLRTALQAIPGTKIVLLDSCYSGSAINRSSASPSAFNSAVISAFSAASRSSVNLEDAGYIVLTSCSKDEVSTSLGDGTVSFGAFTYGICYGSGYDEWDGTSLGYMPADSNGDGAITLGEAHQGVNERINYLKQMIDLSQSAQYFGDTSFVLWRK